MPLRGRKLYTITDPAGVEATGILAANELAALVEFHCEALGRDAVRIRDGQLVFRSPADQEICAGRWRICRQALNGSCAPPVVVEIDEPEWE
jgi:hypothetical protein